MKRYVGIILGLFLLAAVPIFGQSDSKILKPPVTGSDQPPGGVSKMFPDLARMLVSQLSFTKGTNYGSPSDPFDIKGGSLRFGIAVSGFWSGMKYVEYDLKLIDLGYASVHSDRFKGDPVYVVSFQTKIKPDLDPYFFAWKDQMDATRFTEAINRLIYDARRGYSQQQAAAEFTDAARKWREDPSSGPKPPEGWDKHRILAEQWIQEKKFPEAALQYELGLIEFPFWPEGWFNAALIQGELKNYAEAADRMKHYLELAPNAPDAQAAREKMIVWEAKAKP